MFTRNGEVGRGVHSIRVFNVAIVGIVVGLFGIGIVAHRAMGVRTTVDRWIGG